jgi:hypothetical protein
VNSIIDRDRRFDAFSMAEDETLFLDSWKRVERIDVKFSQDF